MRGELHTWLVRAALIWLGQCSTGRGIRGCEEITIEPGYVADAGLIMGLTMEWDRNFFNDEKVFLKKQYCELREQNGWIETDDFSVIVEAKATRPDFRNTFHRDNHGSSRLKPKANFHFVVTEKKIISPEEVPDFWGHLEASRGGLRLRKFPKFIPTTREQLHEFAYKVLRYTTSGKYSVFGMRNELDKKLRDQQSLFKEPQLRMQEIF